MEKGSLSAVYFERLQDDATKYKYRPELLDTLVAGQANYKPLSSEIHGFGGASAILGMAAAEAAKEQAMLQQIFGVSLNIDLKQPGAIKQLTEAINDVFNFRSIYERNKALITNEKFAGQKGVFSYFHTYFNQAIRSQLPQMKQEIISLMESNKSLGAGEAALQVFNKWIPKLTNDAIDRMFNKANTELNGKIDSKHQGAYKELLDAISKFSSKNMFTAQLAQKWGLDKAAIQFSEQFSKQHRKPGDKTMEKARVAAQKEVRNSMHAKGGYSLEILIDQALSAVAGQLNGDNATATRPAHVYKNAGDLGARPDNVFTFNMNTGVVDDILKRISESPADRQVAVEEFSKLGSQLDKVKNGFIVYVNDKNYSLNKNYRGMSAGTSWNLEQIQGILGGVVGNITQIVYNLLQTGSGAIHGGETEDTSRILAEGIAYYLFDDYTTIGNAKGNAIHIMGLQGMLVPLSAFLYALGNAIASVESNPTSYVRVTISSPPVNDSNEASYGMENWDRQYNESMQNTMITIHFMENFIDFVKGYL